jgi:hypothetical protein
MDNTFSMQSWDEKIVSGIDGAPRVAHAHATMKYSGVIEGTSTVDFLLFYVGEGYEGGGHSAPGFERIEGSVDGRKGSFVIRHEIGFGANGIHGTWEVVAGSGSDELTGLTGTGTLAAKSGQETVSYTWQEG